MESNIRKEEVSLANETNNCKACSKCWIAVLVQANCKKICYLIRCGWLVVWHNLVTKRKFIKEAQTLASLEHPNIVKIYDVFEENGPIPEQINN